MTTIRGGRGLGDSIYVRPIVEHLLDSGQRRVIVCSDYPSIFAGLECSVEPHRRDGVDVLAHYTRGKSNPRTTQWEDICASAGIFVPLKITWQRRHAALIEELRGMARGRPLVLVHGGRTHRWSQGHLLPAKRAFDAVLGELKDCFTVRVGGTDAVYPLETSVDLSGRTSVADLIDLGRECDGIVGQCSFAVPLAEVFDKPAMFVWASSGLAPQRHAYLRQITPRKILSKPTSVFVMDSWTDEQIKEEVRAFRLYR